MSLLKSSSKLDRSSRARQDYRPSRVSGTPRALDDSRPTRHVNRRWIPQHPPSQATQTCRDSRTVRRCMALKHFPLRGGGESGRTTKGSTWHPRRAKWGPFFVRFESHRLCRWTKYAWTRRHSRGVHRQSRWLLSARRASQQSIPPRRPELRDSAQPFHPRRDDKFRQSLFARL